MGATEPQPRASRAPFSLKVTADLLVRVRQEINWKLFIEKEVVLIVGESGAGKTTFIQAMMGESLERTPNDLMAVVGTPKHTSLVVGYGVDACTLGVNAISSNSVVYVDSAGVPDSRGLSYDITNAICIRQAWQQAGGVKPVYVISYLHIQRQRFVDLVPLFECYAEMLGHDQQAIEDTVYVIHRIPKNLNKDHIEGVVEFFNLMSESTDIGDGAFSVACAIVNQLREKKVIYFDPTSVKSKRECTRRLQSIDAITPNEVVGQFSLAPDHQEILQSHLKEIVAQVHFCLKEGNSAEVLELIKTLQLLADELPLVKSTLEEVKKFLSEETIKSQQKAMAILMDVCKSLDHWTADISLVNTELQQASALVELEEYFPEAYMPLKKLEASIVQTARGLLEQSKRETEISKVGQLHRKLNRLMDVIELGQSWDGLRESSLEVLKVKITSIITALEGFQISEAHASEEEIHRDYTEACKLMDDLRQAEVHLGPLLPENLSMNFMAHRTDSVEMLTAQLLDVQEAFCRRAQTAQVADEYYLKRLFCILRVAASHAHLSGIMSREALKNPLKQAKEQTVAKISEILKNLQNGQADVHQLAPIQILGRIDPFFQVELTQPLACLFQSMLEDLPELENSFKSKLSEPVDGEGLQNLYRQVEARGWMDQFPANMNRIKKTLDKMEELILSKLRQIERSQKRMVGGGDCDGILKHCIMLRELDCFEEVTSIAEMIEKLKNSFSQVITKLKREVNEVCDNPRADYTPVADEETIEVITFKQAERYLGQLLAFQSSAVQLSIPVHQEIENLQGLPQRKAEKLVKRISTNHKNFGTIAAILEALEILPTLRQEIVPEAARDAHRKGLVALQGVLSAIETEVDTLIAENNLPEARELVNLFAQQYRLLLPALSTSSLDLDLPNRAKELRVKLRSHEKKAEENVDALFDEGDFQEIISQRQSADDPSKYRFLIQKKVDQKIENLLTLVDQTDIQRDHVDRALLQQISSAARELENSKRLLGMKDIQYHEAKVKQCYDILDNLLERAVHSNIDQLSNGELKSAHRFHNQLLKCCDCFGDTMLTNTRKALREFEDAEKRSRNVSEEFSLLKLESLYRHFKEPRLRGDVTEAIRNKLRTKSTEIMEAASHSPERALQLLAQLKLDISSVKEAELLEMMDNVVTHTESLLNDMGQKVEQDFRFALNTNNISRLSQLKQEHTNPTCVRQFNDMVTTKLSQMEAPLASAVMEEDLEKFSTLAEEYKRLEALFPDHTGVAFGNTNAYNLLRKTVQQHHAVTEENQRMDISSRFPPEYTHAVSYLFLVYRQPQLRSLVDEDMLLAATTPVQRVLGQVNDRTLQGYAQYDLDRLCQACDACKTFADLISLFKKETFPDRLSMLQACCQVKSYAEVKADVESFVRSLPSLIEEIWREHQDAKPITRCMESFLSPSVETIRAHVSDIKDIRQRISNTCTVLCAQAAVDCARAYRNSDPNFSVMYLLAMKLQNAEKMTKEREIEKMEAMIKADINERVRGLKNCVDIPTLVAGLKELAQMMEEHPAIEKLIRPTINQLLLRKRQCLSQIEAHLTNDLDNATSILMSFPAFSGLQQKRWVKDTEGVSPELAAARLKSSGLQDPSILKQAYSKIMKLLPDREKQALIRECLAFEKEFKQFIEKHQIGTQWDEIQKETRTLCQNRNLNLPRILARVLGVWSLSKSNMDFDTIQEETDHQTRQSWLQPHAVQVIGLLKMLERQRGHDFVNQLSQIKTGEGKSVILGTLSVVLALCGYSVHCICYATHLSERDAKEFEFVFDKFGVTQDIKYSDILDMCRTQINDHGDIRPLVDRYIHGELLHEGTVHQDGKQKKKTALLIDEVDVFFGPSFYGNTFNPATRVQNEHTFELIKYIWRNRDSNLTLVQVASTTHYQELLKLHPKWANLFHAEISKMLLDCHNWNTEYPTPLQDKIAYAINGNTSFTTAFGYCTSFAYFKFHDDGEISLQSLKDHVGIQVVYGIFSFAKIPELFDLVMGVSGTLAELSDVEKEILSSYGFRTINFCASMYGESRLRFTPQSDVQVVEGENEWMLKISQSAQDQIAAGRAVIVVFGTQAVLRDFERTYRDSFDAQRFQVLTESSDFKSNIIRRACQSKMLTLITRSFGRGSDFACLDQITRGHGGVHVIQSFMSESAAEETQVQGRTARQGVPGSYEMLLCQEEVINEGLTAEQIQNAREQSTLYQLLTKRRDEKHEESIRGLMEGQVLAEQEHAKTMELHRWLIAFSEDNSESIQLRMMELNGCQGSSKPYHIYFVLDDSGSMIEAWSSLMDAVRAFISRRIEMCEKAGILSKDVVTIVNYSCSAQVMCENAPLDLSVTNHTHLRGGGTDFKVGLQLTYDQMAKATDTHAPVLLFMSDGGCANGNEEMQMIARDFSPEVFVFGFSKHCAAQKLETLARIAGGRYYEGSTAVELKECFEEVSTRVSSVSF